MGRPAKYPWHLLQKPGDTFYVPGETAAMLTPNAAKAAVRMGHNAVIRCITYNGGCWVLLADYDRTIGSPKPRVIVEDSDEDPDEAIRHLLVDGDEDVG